MQSSHIAHNALSRRSFIAAGAGAAAASLAAAGSAMAAEGSASADAKGAADASAPKYIFLFIGDGMGNEQVQIASFFKGTTENAGAVVSSPLSFMQFPTVGSVTTYDSSSFCPDSASTATSIATGHKTLSGTINMDPETLTTPYETIAEKLHSQKGFKVGVLTTVNMNHATPAAFYGHQAKRSNYYELGEELAASGFEYFAGGAFLAPTGKEEDKTDLRDVATEAGYTVVETQADAKALKAGDGNVLILSEQIADGGAMNYDLDAAEGEWRLVDYVEKGIELLSDAENGFFMMTEGGKVDWACHANDAASSIHDVLALDTAVQAAVKFYEEHADETLILVTADHETGGLGIGYKTTNYDTFLGNLTHQTMSYAKFDTDYVAKYVEDKPAFADVLADVKACFGLMAADDEDAAQAGEAGVDGSLVMTDYELDLLHDAYQRTIEVGEGSQDEMAQPDYELYGTYQPFSMCICHILDQKAGIGHTTYAHTGAPVNIYALGCGAEQFAGAFDNTQIYEKLAALTNVQ
ncbi:MAG: alkaline phosphatase [Coriobacteriia bacterium]|nr:alkaline phosphatase [Coriobacteriia bacterium]